MSRRAILPVVAGICSALLGASTAAAAPVDVQLLAYNDFHGHVERAPQMASLVAQRRAPNRAGTIVVSAGDNVGASPLTSALFHDEPAIEALDALGTEFSAVGNHEFDEGVAELRRLQRGGCHPADGCAGGHRFRGADFRYLAANVASTASNRAIFPAAFIRPVRGVKLAFVGLTLQGTPSIVTPSGVRGVRFTDEADTLNDLVPRLRRRGADAIVVLLHEGGTQTGGANQCRSLTGPVRDIVERSSDAVDVWVTGHTHEAYDCRIDGDLVTSAGSFGGLLTDIDLRVDARRGVVSARASNVEVGEKLPSHAAVARLVRGYERRAAPRAGRVIGSTTAAISRADSRGTGESALGDVIADAQLAATTGQRATIAFMNPGGIRASLARGRVTYGEAFTVQPFGNSLVTMDLTGTQVERLLEQQWAGQEEPRILQVSRGFAYTWRASAPVGDRVDPASVTVGGAPLAPAATYRVTVNSFLADGGDGFTVLEEGTNRIGGDVDLDALVATFRTGPVAPGPQDRITRAP